ncbi:RlpA-like double-psi beta-barrel-protein domain-containing protein-containing protein, partial [Umbelopsis sp. PMI_123]
SKSTFSGDGTYFTPGLGSCGETNTEQDLIAALNAPQMGSSPNPNSNPNCGKYAKVTGPNGTVRVKIVDTCPPCAYGSLDLSPTAFEQIADLAAGRVPITWQWD